MRHGRLGFRHVLGVALCAAIITFGATGSAFALSSISGRVEVWGSGGTALPGVRVEVFDAHNMWGDPSVHTLLGSTLTSSEGTYTVAGLPNDTLVIIAFEDLTGQYRDMVYRSSGLPLEVSNAYMTPINGEVTDVNAYLPTLADLAAGRIARPQGTDRYGTSAAISKSYFGEADTVIIASGEGFADALSAAPLAGAYDAPILLTRPTTLPTVIGAEIQRLGATRAFIIGSTTAVSDSVKTQLAARGITTITRLGGANRYATAEKVIYALPPEYFEGGAIPFVCRGDNFADALSASPVSAYYGMPILLTTTSKLPAESVRAWKYMVARGSDLVFVVGSKAAVADGILGQLDSYVPSGLYYARIYGDNRYETGAMVAEFFGPWDVMGLASGANFPDALSGGAAVGRYGGCLTLTTPTSLHYAARSTIEENALYSLDLEALGSTAALSAGTFNSAINALGTDFYDIDNPSGHISLTGVSPLGCFLEQANALRSTGLQPASADQRATERLDLRSLATDVWSAK